MEELVAELASAFLCADLVITPEIREDHASYIASWLKVLKDDKRAVFFRGKLRLQGRGLSAQLAAQVRGVTQQFGRPPEQSGGRLIDPQNSRC